MIVKKVGDMSRFNAMSFKVKLAVVIMGGNGWETNGKVGTNFYSVSQKYLIYYNYATALYNYSVTYFYLPKI